MATCPRRRTVSTGNRRKSSVAEERKVANEYVEGVITGSMASVERRMSGVEDEIIVGRVAWMSVAGRSDGVTDIEGSNVRDGHIVLGGAEVGVMINLVRIRSSGASASAAMAVAETATASDNNGLGLSIISSPPIPLAAVPMRPGSGIFKTADSRLRVHDSVALSRKLYTKVTFVPFHTPHIDSFCQSCDMTSSSESAFLNSSLRCAMGGRVGVEDCDRCGARLPLRSDDLEPCSVGEYGSGMRGAVLVKYPGESSSLSSDG